MADDATPTGAPAPGTPVPLPTGATVTATPRPRRTGGIVRWRGLIPLVLLLGLLAFSYATFAEPVARESLEEAATKALGTQVDIRALRILERQTAIEMDGIAIADPFDPMRNLFEIGGLRVELERDPLLARRVVVRRLGLQRVRHGTRRTVAAKPVTTGGYAPQALRAVRAWRQQFDVPLLTLSAFDTVRSLVLDPRQLGTVKAAVALRDRADSTRTALELELRALRLREVADSVRATAQRLAAIDPKSLDVVRARAIVADVRRAADSVTAARRRLDAFRASATLGITMLRDDAQLLDSARRADYAFARGLLRLPTFDAPDIGSALFGDVSIDRFEQLVYWSELARGYLPPGLQPRQTRGPERLRKSGTTVRFARARAAPDFLLRRADVDFVLEGKALTSGAWTLSVADVSTQPGLVPRPMTFAVRRTGGVSGARISVRGLSDRRTRAPRDQVVAEAAAIPLPSFQLPVVPYRLALNTGTSALAFSRAGDAIQGRWTVRADAVTWTADTARVARANYVEGLVYRVISGLRNVELETRVAGTLAAPRLSVRSNLDRAIAERMRTVLGEEIRRGEALARAKVDSVVRVHEAAARARVEALRLQADERLAEAQQRLDAERDKLEAERARLETRLESLVGSQVRSIPSIPKLPKLELPPLPRRRPPADTAMPPDTATPPADTTRGS